MRECVKCERMGREIEKKEAEIESMEGLVSQMEAEMAKIKQREKTIVEEARNQECKRCVRQ